LSDIPSPDLVWREDGSPESKQYGDIYFSVEDGLAETRHVFLDGNHLPDAWSDGEHFTIGETGFGTGLNFLATLALWHKTRKPNQRLHFVSVEGFPLRPDDLSRALSQWPDLKPFAELLVNRYPTPSRGTHQITFPDNVSLTLIEDDALSALQNLDATIDAWFLDGFSPATNPDMWSESLFEEIARSSKQGTTLATFTAAGAVRRGLAAQGFTVEKIPGFGRKREMIVGQFENPSEKKLSAPWYQRPAPAYPKNVAIVGAGVAGLAAADALSRAGISATLIDEVGVGSGASGNPAALFMPRMAVDQSAEGQFHIAAYLHAERWLGCLPVANRHEIFRNCGVLQIATNQSEAKRFETLFSRNLLPTGHLEFVSASDLRGFVGIASEHPALFFPKSGVLKPSALLQYLQGHITLEKASVHSLAREGNVWSLRDAGGSPILETDSVILANGPGLATFAQTSWLPLEPVRGQLTFLPEGVLQRQQYAIVAGHYLISHEDGSALTGATYELGDVVDTPLTPTNIGHRHNLDAWSEAIPGMKESLSNLDPASLSGRVALRTQVPDRVPFAGAAPDEPAYREAYDRLRHGDRFAPYPPAPYVQGLYLLGGLGARGFSTAQLLAEHLVAHIVGSPSPLPLDMAEAIHPARFIVRGLRKNLL
jgi:tRNA 5-methylaminomethyl-2-thiouridine biosynthesis bifunctional protein